MDLSILSDESTIICMQNATYAWDAASFANAKNDSDAESMKPILEELDIKIRKSELAFIVGPVGSGKTSFANALLGEMTLISGKYAIQKDKRIAYVSQTPWIINGTVLENIIFGRNYDPVWFDEVIQACAMEHDLSLLPDKENTVLGERGVNLSGGQRARLTLARAVYAKADIYSKRSYNSVSRY